jgi:hypothetical protein
MNVVRRRRHRLKDIRIDKRRAGLRPAALCPHASENHRNQAETEHQQDSLCHQGEQKKQVRSDIERLTQKKSVYRSFLSQGDLAG